MLTGFINSCNILYIISEERVYEMKKTKLISLLLSLCLMFTTVFGVLMTVSAETSGNPDGNINSIIEAVEYTVTVRADGEIGSLTVLEGSKISAADLNNAVPGTEFTIVGWYKDSIYTTEWNFDDPVTGNMELFAKHKYPVVFKNADGTDLYTEEVEYNEFYEGSIPAPGEVENKKFACWTEYQQMSGYDNFDFDGERIQGPVTLYPAYVEKVKISFDNMEHGEKPEDIIIYQYERLKDYDKELPNLAEEGYLIKGWYTDKEFDHSFGVDHRVYNDITLYAKWEKLTTTSSDIPKDEPTPAPTEEPAKDEHTHKYSDSLNFNSTEHYYVCKCGKKKSKEAHSYNAEGNCTECGYYNPSEVVVIAPVTTPVPTPAATPAPTEEPTPVPTEEPVEMPTEADTTITEVAANETVVETVKENVTVTGETATVEKETLKAVADATEEGAPVVLPLTEATEEAVNNVNIDTEALAAVADSEKDVVIQLTDATVKLDAKALKAVTEQAKGETVEIRVVKAEIDALTEEQKNKINDVDTAVIVSAQIFSDGEYIGEFKGGNATIMIPFEPEEGREVKDYSVYYINGKGELEKVAAEYVDGNMVFTTAHFSEYVIVYEGAQTAPVVPEAPAEAPSASMPIIPIIVIVVVAVAAFIVLKKKKA